MLLVSRVHVKMPGVPSEALGVNGSVEVLKLNVAAAMPEGFETPPPDERQSDSSAAPVWHAESVVPLIVELSEVKTRLNGLDVSL